MRTFDVAIIGGGIVGLATAWSLVKRKRGQRIALIEAESELAKHQTGHNSGVIHSGLYYKPGSLKAKNCIEGREAMYLFCSEHEIPHERCGKIVVASDKNNLPRLVDLKARGVANGLQNIKQLGTEELHEYEPHVAGVGGLFIPHTGIVDYSLVSNKFTDLIRQNGAEIFLSTKFSGLRQSDNKLVLLTDKNPVHAKYLINCAGLQSDRVARKCGVEPNVRIIPFRGEYYKIRPEKSYLVNNLIYPVPDPEFPFLGVHFTRMINGTREAGPNAVLSFKREGYSKFSFSLPDTWDTFTYPGFIRLAAKYMKMGMGEFYRSYNKQAFVRSLKKLIPEIEANDIITGETGVRAQALERDGFLVDDFRIVEADKMIHVLNAPSPAATASLSIGEKIAAMAVRKFSIL